MTTVPRTGKEQVEYIKNVIDKNSKKFFTKVDNTEGQYIMGAESAEKAQGMLWLLTRYPME